VKQAVLLIYIMQESVHGTNQYCAMKVSFLVKETTGTIDGVCTHAWQESTNQESDVLTNVPHRLLIISLD